MTPRPTREDLVAALAGFPSLLEVAAHRAAGRSAADGEWSSQEVVRHLIAVERDVHQARLRDLPMTSEPRWSWAEPGPWPGEPELGLDGVLRRFAAARDETVAILRSLDDTGWARTGHHSTFGLLDVAGLAETAADHDRDHLDGLRQGPSTGG